MRWLGFGLLSLLIACNGDKDDVPSDGGMTQTCEFQPGNWPEDPDCPVGGWPADVTPGGEVEIGTGVVGWEPMPGALPFIMGTQSGTFLVVHARMRGLEPGNPKCFLDPANPRTRFTAILQDGTEVTARCPGTIGYVESSSTGWFERKTSQNLEFLPFCVGQKAFDTDFTIRVEIVDESFRYASDEVVVHGIGLPDGMRPDAGCEAGDAGAGSDAGAPDATDGG